MAREVGRAVMEAILLDDGTVRVSVCVRTPERTSSVPVLTNVLVRDELAAQEEIVEALTQARTSLPQIAETFRKACEPAPVAIAAE